MGKIWQGWTTPHITAWPPTTPLTCSDVNLVLGKRSLNNVPHQWYSVPRMIILLWICDHTVSWMLYDACTMSDRGESPHRPQHDLQLCPRNDQLLPWFSVPRAWTIYLTSVIVIQGQWYMCIDILSHCFMSVIWGMDHNVWQRWIASHTTGWPPTTPWTCSAVTLVLRPKSLNNVPH